MPFIMVRKLLSAFCCTSLVCSLSAQNLSLTTSPPLNGGNGSGAVAFTVSATVPVIIDSIAGTLYNSSPTPGPIEVWTRSGNMGAAPTVDAANGWTLEGTATMTPVNTTFTNVVQQGIPVAINRIIMPGSSLSIAYGRAVGASVPFVAYTTHSTANQDVFTNQHISILTNPGNGYGGAFPTLTLDRQFNGTVYYSLLLMGQNNAGAISLTTPNLCPGSQPVDFTFGNFGQNIITSLTLNWEVNGVPQLPVSYSGSLDTAGSANGFTATQTLGNITLTPGVTTTVRAWTSQPNGQSDPHPSNDTIVVTFSPRLSGAYTLNPAQTTAGTNFQTLNDLATALSTVGVCGPVVVQAASGATFTEQVSFSAIPGASAQNTVRIIGNGAQVSFAPVTGTRYIVQLNGVSYLTVEDFSIVGTSSGFGFGIHLTGGCQFDTIRNNTIDLSVITSTTAAASGGIIGSNSNNSNTTNGLICDYCAIEGNTITGTGGTVGPIYGIRLNGLIGSGLVQTKVSNNIVRDIRQYGIWITNSDSVLVDGNRISRPSLTSLTTYYGVYTSGTNHALRISGNRIHDFGGGTSTTTASYGIFITGSGTTTAPTLIANNLIDQANSNGQLFGIHLSTADNRLIYHNSIIFDNNQTTSGSASYGVFVQGAGSGSEFTNNLIYNTRTGNGTKYGIYLSSGTVLSQLDYNTVYLNAPGVNSYGYIGSNQLTQQDFIQASGGQYQQTGLTSDPLFQQAAQADYTPTAAGFAASGLPLGGVVSDDYSGNPRFPVPTPGAFEAAPLALDAGIVSLVSPSGSACGSSDSVWVRIRNYGTGVLNSVTMGYSVNGVVSPNQTFSGLALPIGADTLLFLGIHTYSGNPPYLFNTYISLANGQADMNVLNDSLQVSLGQGMLGVYTLDPGAVPSPINYTTLQSFANDLSQRGVCGQVDLFVSPTAVLNEQVTFSSVPGTSFQNQIHIHGQGAWVTASPTSANRYIVQLSGVSHLRIDSLNVRGLSATWGYGYHLTQNARFDTIAGCEIDLTQLNSTAAQNSGGIVISGQASSNNQAGNNANYCGFLNNYIRGSSQSGFYYGISLNGAASGSGASANLIEGNQIENAFFAGIYISGADSLLVRGNRISRPGLTNSGNTFYGIYPANTTRNARIESNEVFNTGLGNPANTTTTYGYFSNANLSTGDSIVIANNKFYAFQGNGAHYGMYFQTAPRSKVYHNTVALIDNSPGLTAATYGIFLTGSALESDVRNNIFSLERNSTGVMYGIYLSGTASPAQVDHQVVHINAPQANAFYGFVAGSAQLTRQNFVTASNNQFEQNSLTLNPNFVNPVGFNFQPSNPGIDNNGANLSAAVPVDFFGVQRGIAPDPGAVEFTVLALDAGVSAVVSPSGIGCPGNVNVQVRVRNYGSNTLQSVTVGWTANAQAQTPQTFTNLALASGLDTLLSLGSFNFQPGVSYQLAFWTSQPNGATDLNFQNDTLHQMLVPGMAGVYTIDQNQALGGSNYQNIDQAMADLLLRGVCGNVFFDIVNPLEVTQLTLGAVTGMGANSRVHFRSQALDSTAAVIRFNSTGTVNNFVVRFSGATYYTFEHLTLWNGGTSFARVLDFAGNNEHNIVRNCILLSDTVNPGSNLNKVVVFSNNNTPGDNHNHIANNLILGGAIGINWYGSSTQVNEMGNRFTGNIFRRQNSMVGDFRFQNQLEVANNHVTFTSTLFAQTFGFQFRNAGNGLRCNANYIQGIGDHPTQCIRLETASGSSGTPALVSNNMLATGDQNTVSTQFQIYLDGSANVRLLHNSATLNNSPNGSANLFATNCSGLHMLYNNFANFSGNPVAYFTTDALPVQSDRNNLFISSGDFMQFNLQPLANLAAWQTASGGDANSISVNPAFISSTNLRTCSPALDGQALPHPLVSFDIDGNTRNAFTPDIGAAEFQGTSAINLGPDAYLCSGGNVTIGGPVPGATSYSWTGGANTPALVVSQPGNYTLTTTGGCQAASGSIQVIGVTAPSAAFSVANQDPQYNFTSQSTGILLSYNWDFDDGNTSVQENPSHTYVSNGTYTVSLTVTDTCGQTDTFTQTVTVGNATGLEDAFMQNFTFGPNPGNGLINYRWEHAPQHPVHYQLFDLSGRKLHASYSGAVQGQLHWSGLPVGTYLLHVTQGHQQAVYRIVISTD